MTPLDQRLLVAEAVPGFGGMYWGPGSDPALNVYLQDMAGQEAAAAAITAVLGEAAIPPDGITFHQGRYGIARLASWAACLAGTPVGDAGPVRADVDETVNGVQVLVESPRAQELVEEQMQRLSIPAEAVRFRVGRHPGTGGYVLDDGSGVAGLGCRCQAYRRGDPAEMAV